MPDPRSLVRRQLGQLQSAYWERRLGVSTRGFVPAGAPVDHHDYSSLPYGAIFAVLDALRLRTDDVFLDLGSGKGRVLCCAARRQLRSVRGVEYSEDLCHLARENVAHLRGRHSEVRVDCGPAEEADLSDVTVLYLYNPFGEDTLRLVLDRLGRSLEPSPRAVRLAYVNPEHEGALQRSGLLECYRRWSRGQHPSVHHAVSFWRNGHIPGCED